MREQSALFQPQTWKSDYDVQAVTIDIKIIQLGNLKPDCVCSCGPYSRAINTALNYAKIYLNKYFYSRGCLSHNGHFLLVFFMLYWTLPQSERGFVSFHVWVIESGSSNGEYFFTFTNVKHTNGPDWLLFIYLVRFKEGQHLIKTKNIHKLYEVTGKSSNIRVKIQETK